MNLLPKDFRSHLLTLFHRQWFLYILHLKMRPQFKLQKLYFKTNPYDMDHIKQTPWKTEFVNNYSCFFFLEMNQFCQKAYFQQRQLLLLQYNLSINKELNSSLNPVDDSQDKLSQLQSNYLIVHRNVSSFRQFHIASSILTEDVGNKMCW